MNFPRKNQKPEIPAQRTDGLGGPRKVSQRDRDQPVRRWDNRNPLLDAVLMIFLVSETYGGSGRYPDGRAEPSLQEALRRSSDGNKQLVTVVVDLDQFVLLGQTIRKSLVENNRVHIGKRHCKRFGPQWIIDE